MTAGTEVAIVHGPLTEVATNQMPLSTAYQVFSSTMMTGAAVLTTYLSGVPLIGSSFGLPSKFGGVILAVLMSTLAVWGTLLETTASLAWRVPGTEAFVFSLGLVSGILAKSLGSLVPGTYSHGPSRDAALNQRP